MIKVDGHWERFDIEKLRLSVSEACGKLRIDRQRQERVVGRVLAELLRYGPEQEAVTTTEIGLRVLRHLYDIDKVAFARFAMYYSPMRNQAAFHKWVDEVWVTLKPLLDQYPGDKPQAVEAEGPGGDVNSQ